MRAGDFLPEDGILDAVAVRVHASGDRPIRVTRREHREAMRVLAEKGLSNEDIAVLLGGNRAAVEAYRRRAGFPLPARDPARELYHAAFGVYPGEAGSRRNARPRSGWAKTMVRRTA